jgi:hypothetical protein
MASENPDMTGLRRRAPAAALAAIAVLVVIAAPVASETQEGPNAVRSAIVREDVPELRTALASLALSSSVDQAARVFMHEIEAIPRNRQFRVRVERALAGGPPALPEGAASRWLFVLVPGWLYQTDPETGADLARVGAVLQSLGLASRRAPLDENGTVEANGEALAREIARLEGNGRELILVSTSKGGAETLLALDDLRQQGRAHRVVAWVNIAGLLNGTGVADHWSAWPRNWLTAILFAFRGHGTAAIGSMQTARSRARFEAASLPPDLLVVNYLGVPMASDLSGGVRDRYEILAPGGPNDGLTLLSDAIVPGGITFLQPGFDHMLAMPDLERRVAAVTVALLQTLSAGDPRKQR